MGKIQLKGISELNDQSLMTLHDIKINSDTGLTLFKSQTLIHQNSSNMPFIIVSTFNLALKPSYIMH